MFALGHKDIPTLARFKSLFIYTYIYIYLYQCFHDTVNHILGQKYYLHTNITWHEIIQLFQGHMININK